ncbi:MAG: TetR/AcrR family transcriptional regulator [Algiphilus sp.]
MARSQVETRQPATTKKRSTARRAAARPESTKSGLSWQAEKSLNTRSQILEAGIECLVEYGYAEAKTERIAKRAGVSRGAMTHHFPSRAELFQAIAQHIIEKRAEEFEELIKGVNVPEGQPPRLEDMRQTMTVLQRFYTAPTFVALDELLRGARTDDSLIKMLVPLEKRLDQKIAASLLRRFPFWSAINETREVLTDLVTFTLQGVAVNPAPYVGDERMEHLIDLLAHIAMHEFEQAYESSPELQKAIAQHHPVED